MRFKLMLILLLIFLVCIIQIDQACQSDPRAVAYEEPTVVLYSISDTDREMVERVVAAESRGQSLLGQLAVAQVIFDRSTLWNKTIEEVLTAPSQFAKPYTGEISDTTKEAVYRVFVLHERAFEEPTTHFYAYAVCTPHWADTKVSRGIIGAHRFMY